MRKLHITPLLPFVFENPLYQSLFIIFFINGGEGVPAFHPERGGLIEMRIGGTEEASESRPAWGGTKIVKTQKLIFDTLLTLSYKAPILSL